MLCSKKVYNETINPYYANLIDWEYEYLENWTSLSHPFRIIHLYFLGGDLYFFVLQLFSQVSILLLQQQLCALFNFQFDNFEINT